MRLRALDCGSGEYLMCHLDGFTAWTASQLGRLHSLDGFTVELSLLSRPSPPQHASAHHGASTLSPPFPPQVEYSLLTESETLAALGQGSFVTR